MVALSVGATAVVVGIAVLGWRWADTDATELAQWLMAATSVVTLVAAVAAAVYAAGAFRLEGDREDRWNDAQRRAQAGLVAAWADEGVQSIVLKGQSNELTGEVQGQVTGRQVLAQLRNASEIPVTDVHLTPGIDIVGQDEDGRDHVLDRVHGRTKKIAVLPPASQPKPHKLVVTQPSAKGHELRRLYPSIGPMRQQPFVNIEFTDAAGVRWRRNEDSNLIEIGDRPYLR